MKHPPIALLDACVLVPMPLADTLLRLAEPPAILEARWSEEILAEMSRALIRNFGKAPEKARYREQAMRRFFPKAMVDGHQPLVSQMVNHPKDRHVLAAALTCQADYLVTFNLRDFPQSAATSTAVIGPSALLKILWKSHSPEIQNRLQEQAEAIGISQETQLQKLAQSVPAFVETIRKRL